MTSAVHIHLIVSIAENLRPLKTVHSRTSPSTYKVSVVYYRTPSSITEPLHPFKDSTCPRQSIYEALHTFKGFASTKMISVVYYRAPIFIAEPLHPFKELTFTQMISGVRWCTAVSIANPLLSIAVLQRPLKHSTVNPQYLCHPLLHTCDHFRISVSIIGLHLRPNDFCHL